jgi:hypothetical protein
MVSQGALRYKALTGPKASEPTEPDLILDDEPF